MKLFLVILFALYNGNLSAQVSSYDVVHHLFKRSDDYSEIAENYNISEMEASEFFIENTSANNSYLGIIPIVQVGTSSNDTLEYTHTHTSKEGESIASIASAYGFDPKEIFILNSVVLGPYLKSLNNREQFDYLFNKSSSDKEALKKFNSLLGEIRLSKGDKIVLKLRLLKKFYSDAGQKKAKESPKSAIIKSSGASGNQVKNNNLKRATETVKQVLAEAPSFGTIKVSCEGYRAVAPEVSSNKKWCDFYPYDAGDPNRSNYLQDSATKKLLNQISNIITKTAQSKSPYSLNAYRLKSIDKNEVEKTKKRANALAKQILATSKGFGVDPRIMTMIFLRETQFTPKVKVKMTGTTGGVTSGIGQVSGYMKKLIKNKLLSGSYKQGQQNALLNLKKLNQPLAKSQIDLDAIKLDEGILHSVAAYKLKEEMALTTTPGATHRAAKNKNIFGQFKKLDSLSCNNNKSNIIGTTIGLYNGHSGYMFPLDENGNRYKVVTKDKKEIDQIFPRAAIYTTDVIRSVNSAFGEVVGLSDVLDPVPSSKLTGVNNAVDIYKDSDGKVKRYERPKAPTEETLKTFTKYETIYNSESLKYLDFKKVFSGVKNMP